MGVTVGITSDKDYIRVDTAQTCPWKIKEISMFSQFFLPFNAIREKNRISQLTHKILSSPDDKKMF